MHARNYLSSLLETALASVEGRRCVHEFLEGRQAPVPDRVIAIGKAAGSMLLGVHDYCVGRALPTPSSLVISKPPYMPEGLAKLPDCRVVHGGHPLPDQHSLQAGCALQDFIDQLHPGSRVLCLISGGASALVEVLQPGTSLSELARINQWLLASGLAIHEINAVRKRLSRIKGGGLSALLAGQEVSGLVISDVAGDDLAVIGSGMLVVDRNRPGLPASLPNWVLDTVQRIPSSEPVAGLAQPPLHIVASNRQACMAAADRARGDGWQVQVVPQLLAGDARTAGEAFAERLGALPAGSVLIQGGETTVSLPAHPGRGGRNQTLALAAARRFAGEPAVYLLAAGTDGIDGQSEHAGALVDGGTVQRGRQAGLDADECLRRADSATFLEKSGDVVDTGCTGTNVMDIILALKTPGPTTA